MSGVCVCVCVWHHCNQLDTLVFRSRVYNVRRLDVSTLQALCKHQLQQQQQQYNAVTGQHRVLYMATMLSNGSHEASASARRDAASRYRYVVLALPWRTKGY